MRKLPTILAAIALAALGACGRSRFQIGEDWRASLDASGPFDPRRPGGPASFDAPSFDAPSFDAPSLDATEWRDAASFHGAVAYQDTKKASDASAEPKSQESQAVAGTASFLTVLALYIPNRILDIGDIARAGVNVGPGIGTDLCATESVRAAAMFRTSVGVGYETLRHMPVMAGGESYADVGPISSGAVVGGPIWYRQFWDIRPEFHVVLVGAHVAINPAEILDAILGFTTIDIMHDDL